MGDGSEHQIALARAWLAGYTEMHRRVPNRAYIEPGSATDQEARLSLAQLLVDGNAPRDLLELLASCIAPDFQPPDGISLPARGVAITPSDNPLRIVREGHSRRLDFSFRKGTRRRGAPQQTDAIRDSAILSMVMTKVVDGETKTAAFEKVGREVGLSTEAVRKIWKNYPSFVKYWEGDTEGDR